MDLIVELVSGTAGSSTKGVTALNHEAVNDAVENRAIEKGTRGGLTVGGVNPFAFTLCK